MATQVVRHLPIAFSEGTLLDLGSCDGIHFPQPSRLSEPLEVQGKKAAEAAVTLGLTTVGALLEHLPRGRRESMSIAELQPGMTATVTVAVRSISSRPVRRRGMRPLVEAVVADESAAMAVSFFNQPWLVQRYPAGTRLVLHGKYQAGNKFSVQSHAPTAEVSGPGGTDVAHYPATEGLSSTQIFAMVKAHHDAFSDVVEPLPMKMRIREGLPDRACALYAAHFGDHEGGRRRLAFDELLLLQIALLMKRAQAETDSHAPPVDGPAQLTTRWLKESLPFEPTDDQRRAMKIINTDLAASKAMQRLLMGEVGSGKTVVALYAMLRAVESGAQAVLMAPTETLAEQHFATLQKLMPGELVQAGLLTGSTPGSRRTNLLGLLATGELKLLVGTHALIEDAVEFNHLAVAVIDEQHRFGVAQRAALNGKARPGTVPHVLHMTATPIPRTLALTAYGDLDVTVLKQLPAGRRPISTFLASSDRERVRAYERIREELQQGRQAFVVCPLVAESEALQARAAADEHERLSRTEFKDYRVELLHGQMSSREKQQAMAAFADGAADVLVATTVIEVGIDVPNATVMLIENAERYGISQLHQLRGRIGRGGHESVCILFGPKQAPRLKALASSNDGFKLAEIDLELRGEGEVLGTRQSGIAQFKVAELPQDFDLLERARVNALELLESDPELKLPEHVLLADAVMASYGEVINEPIPG